MKQANDSIVTVRVPRETKEAVALVLKGLGTTPSEAVNKLYSYILENKRLPFDDGEKPSYTMAEIESALAEIEALAISADSPFNDMTNAEILHQRAVSRGLVVGEDALLRERR